MFFSFAMTLHPTPECLGLSQLALYQEQILFFLLAMAMILLLLSLLTLKREM